MKKYIHNWPFWIMLLFAVSYGAFYIYQVIEILPLLTKTELQNPFYIIWGFFWEALFLAQAIYYRRVRKKLLNIKLVRIHLWSTFTALFSSLFLTRAVYFFEYYHGGQHAIYYPTELFMFSIYAPYLLVLTGNAFFIATIVSVYRNKKSLTQTMSNLPASLMASLTNIKGFDKEAFEQVHASGEQVTSIRLNPAKITGQWSMVNGQLPIAGHVLPMVNAHLNESFGQGQSSIANDPMTDSPQSAIRNLQSAIIDLTTNDLMTRATQSAIANLQSTIPWCPNGFYLNERPSFTFDPLFHAGLYYVQEASSMFLWEALRQTVGENTGGVKVLDLCAAPGGKSTLLATYFANGLVVANEVIRNRAAILAENITKWGSANVVVTNNDPKDFAKLEGYFDVMVVDAPCSGSGLFRKDAEAITEWSDANVLLCSQRQQRILADAWASLKNDGVLIYSTCSYSKQEDEDIVGWICSEFGAEPVQLSINEGWGIVEVQDDASKAFGYRFYPYVIKGEGFFIAAFKKRGGKEFADKAGAAAPQKISKEEAAAVAPFISSAEELYYFRQAEIIIAAPARWKNDISLLQKHLYLRKAGITVGELKGKDLVPNHELATSLTSNSGIPSVSLSYQQAIQYLQKKDIQLNNLPKGWALAKYAGISLGWIKVLPNRINNYYPMEWRILKLIHPA